MSNVTNMAWMFHGTQYFNQDIGAWDVSQLLLICGVCFSMLTFNQDIGGWDVSNVD